MQEVGPCIADNVDEQVAKCHPKGTQVASVMAQSVKLGDELIKLVRRESELQSRSVADQLAYWVRTGRASENSGNSDHARITAVLAGDLEPMKLTDEERDVWFDSFTERMARPGPEEEAFFARRRQLGLGIRLDAGGNLVRAEAKRKA